MYWHCKSTCYNIADIDVPVQLETVPVVLRFEPG
jgi:hypothetical protein